ncbi:hypothetical protein GGR55DRAFT_454674 [Xylaria sp. FL0064]|nr:hypothetical protein GGR55DRAFT_454674 [Xylaria sp. FL0064]
MSESSFLPVLIPVVVLPTLCVYTSVPWSRWRLSDKLQSRQYNLKTNMARLTQAMPMTPTRYNARLRKLPTVITPPHTKKQGKAYFPAKNVEAPSGR